MAGNHGRDVTEIPGPNTFFRDERLDAGIFGDLDITLTVTGPEGRQINGKLGNVSTTGLKGVFDVAGVFAFDREFELDFRVRDYQVYHGRVDVRRIHPLDGAEEVAFEFMDGLVNIDQLKRVVKALQLIEPGVSVLTAKNSGDGTEPPETREFKQQLTEFRSFLMETKIRLLSIEKEVGPIKPGQPGFKEIFDPISKELTPVFGAYFRKFDELYRRFYDNKAIDEQMKFFVKHTVRDLIFAGPLFYRSYQKPRGYPGDYRIMMYIYQDLWEGQDLFGRFVHYSGCMDPVSVAVRNRKDLIKGLLHQTLQKKGDKRIRFLSVAAGPAQESLEMLEEMAPSVHPMDIVLYEQDVEALRFSYYRLVSAIKRLRLDKNVKISFIHDSVKNILQKDMDENVLSQVGKFDFISVSGLFDYLGRKAARLLLSKLFELLQPGGTLAVGNMDGINPSRWAQEHTADWYLRYRSRDEFLELADFFPADVQRSIIAEPLNINLFLLIQKPE